MRERKRRNRQKKKHPSGLSMTQNKVNITIVPKPKSPQIQQEYISSIRYRADIMLLVRTKFERVERGQLTERERVNLRVMVLYRQ